MTYAWVGVGLLILVGGSVAYEGLRIRRALERTPVPVRPESRHLGAPITMLFVGDSTGLGHGSSESHQTLVGYLADQYPNADIENVSRSRQTLSGARAALERKRAEHASYTLIIIVAGGADIVFGFPLWLTRRRLGQVLDLALRQARSVLLVGPNNPGLLPLYRFPLAPWYRRRAREVTRVCEAEARARGVRFVSLYIDHDDPVVSRGLISADGAHPSGAGYAVWFGTIKSALIGLV